jgi:hypothetical protein
MTETSTETELENKCANCGAEIRPGSQFCYGCGKPVDPAAEADDTNVVKFPVRSAENVEDEPDEALTAAADAAEEKAEPSDDIPDGFLVPEEAPPEEVLVNDPVEPKKGEQLPGSLPPERTRTRERRRKDGKLETAASIQKRERLRVKKPDEVVWDAADPTWIYAIVAVALLIVSALIFYFAVLGN